MISDTHTNTGLVDADAEDAMCGLHLLSAIAEDLDSRFVMCLKCMCATGEQ